MDSPNGKEDKVLEAGVEVRGGIQLLHLFEMAMVDDGEHPEHSLEDVFNVGPLKVWGERLGFVHGKNGRVVDLRLYPRKDIVHILGCGYTNTRGHCQPQERHAAGGTHRETYGLPLPSAHRYSKPDGNPSPGLLYFSWACSETSP